MKLQKVRLSFDPEVLTLLAQAAEKQGVSVTKLIQHTLKEAADKVLTENTDEQRK